jgi:hypothetical protein
MSADREKALLKAAALYGVAPEAIPGAPGGCLSDADRPGADGPLIEVRRDEFSTRFVAGHRETWELEDEFDEFCDHDWYYEPAIIDLDAWRVFDRGTYEYRLGSYRKLDVRWMWMPLAEVGDEEVGGDADSVPAPREAA